MEICPRGMPDPPLRELTRTESSPPMTGAPWMVFPVAVVRPRPDAAPEPVEDAMLSVPPPPLVSVSVMPLPAELMAAESFDPPTVSIALITSPTVVAPVSETLICEPSEVVTTKSGLPPPAIAMPLPSLSWLSDVPAVM